MPEHTERSRVAAKATTRARRSLTQLRSAAPAPPPGKRIGDTDPDEQMRVTVLVRRRKGRRYDTYELGRMPPGQRRYMTREEFAARRGADPRDIELVGQLATTYGLTAEAYPERRSVVLTGSAGDFSKAFRVKLAEYEWLGTRYRGRETPVVDPDGLRGVIIGVFGLANKPAVRPRPAEALAGPSVLTVTDAVDRYRFPKALTGANQCIGIISLNCGYRRSDLEAHFAKLGLKMPSLTDVSADGASNEPSTRKESTLDIAVAGAAAPDARLVVYFGNMDDQGFLSAVSAAVHDGEHNPTVVSISAGLPERDTSLRLRAAIEEYLVDAAVLGITVCAASGDYGSSGLAPDDPSDGRAHVYFPASSPHVLAVGGTILSGRDAEGLTEVTWNDAHGASGGGVSDFFRMPRWQRSARVPPSVNRSGIAGLLGRGPVRHGVPDVSGHAAGFEIHFDGRPAADGGTSAATPLWAGLVARINQGLDRPLGYINPYLYLHARGVLQGAFNDVTRGDNQIVANGENQMRPTAGYDAVRGWDPCTGLGSPNGEALLEALQAARPVRPRRRLPFSVRLEQ